MTDTKDYKKYSLHHIDQYYRPILCGLVLKRLLDLTKCLVKSGT